MRRKLSPKQIGELAEARFLAKATGLGFKVARPFGESRSYDFIVEAKGKLHRVEVKSACTIWRGGGYTVNTTYDRLGRPYTVSEADFIAAHVIPVDAWYIIPMARLRGLTGLRVYPEKVGTRSRWERFREAWELMEREKQKSRSLHSPRSPGKRGPSARSG